MRFMATVSYPTRVMFAPHLPRLITSHCFQLTVHLTALYFPCLPTFLGRSFPIRRSFLPGADWIILQPISQFVINQIIWHFG
jgi:hypothetical protein